MKERSNLSRQINFFADPRYNGPGIALEPGFAYSRYFGWFYSDGKSDLLRITIKSIKGETYPYFRLHAFHELPRVTTPYRLQIIEIIARWLAFALPALRFHVNIAILVCRGRRARYAVLRCLF